MATLAVVVRRRGSLAASRFAPSTVVAFVLTQLLTPGRPNSDVATKYGGVGVFSIFVFRIFRFLMKETDTGPEGHQCPSGSL